MHVEDIDEVGLKLLQAVPQRQLERTLVIATEVDVLALAVLVLRVGCGELGSNDHVVPVASLLHPLADPGFGLFILVIVGRIDEIAAGVEVGVHELEGLFLAHAAHESGPGVANAHCAQLQGGDTDTGGRGEDPESSQLRLRPHLSVTTAFTRMCNGMTLTNSP